MTDPQRGGTADLADVLGEMGALALALGRIERGCSYHATGRRESVTDHTVMLSWAAPSLAAHLYPGHLDVGLVAQYAAVHDAVEAIAGDTHTLRIDTAGRAAKAAREHAAARQIAGQFGGRLPWLAEMVGRYERQEEPEARFVRAVDKEMPKLVHQEDRTRGMAEEGISAAELAGIYERQAGDISRYAGEWAELAELHRELSARVVAMVKDGETRQSAQEESMTSDEVAKEPAAPRDGGVISDDMKAALAAFTSGEMSQADYAAACAGYHRELDALFAANRSQFAANRSQADTYETAPDGLRPPDSQSHEGSGRNPARSRVPLPVSRASAHAEHTGGELPIPLSPGEADSARRLAAAAGGQLEVWDVTAEPADPASVTAGPGLEAG
jgi:putative hydrolase of HD superfamily